MSKIKLKNGNIVKIDWRPGMTRKNFNFLATADNREIVYKEWPCPANLDQGAEGACAAFGSAHTLISHFLNEPRLNNEFAFALYKAAQKIDHWPGENYSGTTINAVMKQLVSDGWIEKYLWYMTLHDLKVGIGHDGPAAVGLNWYSGMYEPDKDGYIWPEGEKIGGHCLQIAGYTQKGFLLHNSWGKDWGPLDGWCYLRDDAMIELFSKQNGECARPIPMKTAPNEEPIAPEKNNWLTDWLKRWFNF